MRIVSCSHVLAVPDAEITAKFFIEKLGFASQMVIPGQWHFVVRDACRIMLGSCPGSIPPSELGDHSYFAYFNVDNVDALFKEFQGNGLSLEPPVIKPWGMREMAVKTPQGHRMTFGQEVGS
jgi:uncharacterized glyoxalase superfamily protein PhnB